MKTALCIAAYVVGMVIAYIAFRIWTEFDNDLLRLPFVLSLFWPASLCIVILWLIGKGLDQIAYAVRDAIWRAEKKWRKER